MANERTPKGPEPANDRKAEREAKLAQALRANLRRRKADAARSGAGKAEDGDSA